MRKKPWELEPESGKTAIVKYDQSTDEDEEWVCNIRGEVMSRLDDCVDVNDQSRGLSTEVAVVLLDDVEEVR